MWNIRWFLICLFQASIRIPRFSQNTICLHSNPNDLNRNPKAETPKKKIKPRFYFYFVLVGLLTAITGCGCPNNAVPLQFLSFNYLWMERNARGAYEVIHPPESECSSTFTRFIDGRAIDHIVLSVQRQLPPSATVTPLSECGYDYLVTTSDINNNPSSDNIIHTGRDGINVESKRYSTTSGTSFDFPHPESINMYVNVKEENQTVGMKTGDVDFEVSFGNGQKFKAVGTSNSLPWTVTPNDRNKTFFEFELTRLDNNVGQLNIGAGKFQCVARNPNDDRLLIITHGGFAMRIR